LVAGEGGHAEGVATQRLTSERPVAYLNTRRQKVVLLYCRSPLIKVMARDNGLEEIINDELRSTPGLTDKAMFGGWAWLISGKLLCAARDDGMLVRLGKGNDGWALQIAGVAPMLSRGRLMHGWVRANAGAYGDDSIRQRLIECAIKFVSSLPRK
jgi:hypothetical protein